MYTVRHAYVIILMRYKLRSSSGSSLSIPTLLLSPRPLICSTVTTKETEGKKEPGVSQGHVFHFINQIAQKPCSMSLCKPMPGAH